MVETTAREIEYSEFEQRTGFPAVASKAELESRGARHAVFTQAIEHGGRQYRIEQMQAGDIRRGYGYIWKRIVPVKAKQTDNIPFRIHGTFSPDGTEYKHYTMEELVQAIQPEKED